MLSTIQSPTIAALPVTNSKPQISSHSQSAQIINSSHANLSNLSNLSGSNSVMMLLLTLISQLIQQTQGGNTQTNRDQSSTLNSHPAPGAGQEVSQPAYRNSQIDTQISGNDGGRPTRPHGEHQPSYSAPTPAPAQISGNNGGRPTRPHGGYRPSYPASAPAPAPVPNNPLSSDTMKVCEDQSATFNVLANDKGNNLRLVGVSHETPALQTEFETRGGSLSFSADGNINYQGMEDYYGNDKLVYTVENANGRRFTQQVNVEIHAVSDAPVISNTGQRVSTSHRNNWRNFELDDFGTFDDSKDNLQQFSNYNVGVEDDTDVAQSIRITGTRAPSYLPGSVNYRLDNEAINLKNGFEISVDDIKDGKFERTAPGFRGTNGMFLQYQWVDSGEINNDCGGENASPASSGGSGNKPTVGEIHVDTPIALDLNNDGKIGITGATSSYQKDQNAEIGRTVEFDIDADGKKDTIEWFNGSGDGILIDNRDGNAANDMNGARLFGDQGGKFSNGFEKLSQLDTDSDKQLSGKELNGLEVWVDDGDAVVEEGELQSLDQHNIAAISTAMELVRDKDGKDLMRSSATTTDGRSVMTEDVWFSREK